jgi:glycosyltransferase involved in cell wall biosynthesis
VKIGIVTLSFNQARFLGEAIASVTMADPARLAYVIVDPGSTDGSREIVATHPFARVILEPDAGPADGLNKGFKACHADVYGYLNADDRFTPGALDFVAEYFERHPEIDLLQGAIRIVDDRGRPKLRGRAPDRLDPARFVCGAAFAWQQATFFRRELYRRTRGFNPANRVTWDGELVLDMLLAGARLGYTSRVLGDFRVYPASMTGSGQGDSFRWEHFARMRAKFVTAGGVPFPPLRERVERLKYRCNVLRHLRSVSSNLQPIGRIHASGRDRRTL